MAHGLISGIGEALDNLLGKSGIIGGIGEWFESTSIGDFWDQLIGKSGIVGGFGEFWDEFIGVGGLFSDEGGGIMDWFDSGKEAEAEAAARAKTLSGQMDVAIGGIQAGAEEMLGAGGFFEQQEGQIATGSKQRTAGTQLDYATKAPVLNKMKEASVGKGGGFASQDTSAYDTAKALDQRKATLSMKQGALTTQKETTALGKETSQFITGVRRDVIGMQTQYTQATEGEVYTGGITDTGNTQLEDWESFIEQYT